jgi:hypothetical protein
MFFAVLICAAITTGCGDTPTETTATPPPAQTSDQIEQDKSDKEREAAANERAEQEKQRRIERNRNAVSDFMFIGMTLAEANEALGVEGVKGLSIGSGEEEHQAYEWTLEGGVTIKATFINGKLDKKELVE